MKKRYLQIIVPLSLSVAFILVIILFFPFRYRFEFDHDEGVNLIKAMMTLRGYSLYSDIWSDQPPIFNTFLTSWLRLFGMNVNAGRLLVLGFSTVFIASATSYLKRFWGVPHAILGFIAIITLPYYARLSVSVMIGLPSLAIAFLSFVGVARWHQEKRDYWLGLSSFLLAISVMTKLWTIIMVPFFLVGILIDSSGLLQGRRNLSAAIKPTAVWSLLFLLTSAFIIFFMVGPPHLQQLISVHLVAGDTVTMQKVAAGAPMSSYLDDSAMLFILSLTGTLIALRTKNWHALYLAAWTLSGYALLRWIINPFWSHHQLLITLPAAILASIAMGYSLVDLYKRAKRGKLLSIGVLPSAIIILLSLGFCYQRIPKSFYEFKLDLPNFRTEYDPRDAVDYEVLATIRENADGTNYLFTDQPMYAFRAGIPVHPYLAVMTKKRYVAGQLSEEELLSLLTEIKPEQIILTRYEFSAVHEYMKIRNFRRVNPLLKPLHYAKRELIDNP
jgi:hypothetical protein